MTEKLKKIVITSTNNKPYYAESNIHVFPKFHFDYLKKLRKYIISQGFPKQEKQEVQFVFKSLQWVTSQWQHDSMNQPPQGANALKILQSVHQKKKRYRCVEYGLVLAQVLQSFGFITRKISLHSKDISYGGLGQGHVAMEVWVNTLNKWIFLDPQFGSYLTRYGDDTPLNYYEIFAERKKKQWRSLEVKFVVKKTTKSPEQYKNFLKRYFGHISVSSGTRSPIICLSLENKNPTITFQGLASNYNIFTTDPKTLYPPLNRVSLFLEYQETIKNFQKAAKKLQINTSSDYLKKMHLFAAKPNYFVHFQNNMPSFSHYEIRLKKMGPWTKVCSKKISWNAFKKRNYLEARGVNTFGQPGPQTYIELSYT